MRFLSRIMNDLLKPGIKNATVTSHSPSEFSDSDSTQITEGLLLKNQQLEDTNATLERQLIDQSESISRMKNELITVNKELWSAEEKLIALAKDKTELEKLALVASKTNNAVIITDPEGDIEWINDGFVRLCGYTHEEVKGKNPKFLQGPKTDPETIKRISEAIKKRTAVSEEIINYSKRGESYWAKLDIAPVLDENNCLKNFISIQTDITELKEYERFFTTIARELASLIEHANVPVFGIDQEGFITEWNHIAAELTGFSKMELTGTHWLEAAFIAPLNIEKVSTIISEAGQGSSSINMEVEFITKSNQRLVLLLSATARRNAANETTGILFVGQNITELIDYRSNLEQKVEERTRELNTALNNEKEVVKMKNQFISIASHEFRTPLTSISIASGFIRKYKERLSAGDIDEKLNNIEKQVSHMTYLLDDILMVGRAEAGKLLVNKTELNIAHFFKTICLEVEKATERTHFIKLSLQLSRNTITSDEKLLRNIFINLLTNAIKFSPQSKEIQMIISSDENRFAVKVVDFGIGIPDADIKNLFEPFFRAGNASSIHGTGLGLSIIKRAVELLSGNMTIKSTLGNGTEVQVDLPLAQ
jgi:PAS domain S-box-containing protein